MTFNEKDWLQLTSDDTNRLYVKTEQSPEGELITGDEVDKWLDTAIDRIKQTLLERVEGEKLTPEFEPVDIHESGRIIGYNAALKDIKQIVTSIGESEIQKDTEQYVVCLEYFDKESCQTIFNRIDFTS